MAEPGAEARGDRWRSRGAEAQGNEDTTGLKEAWEALAAYAVALGRVNRCMAAYAAEANPENRKLIAAEGRERLPRLQEASQACVKDADEENAMKVARAFGPKEGT